MNRRAITPEGQEKIRLSGLRRFLESATAKFTARFNYSKVHEAFQKQKSPEVEILCHKHDTSFWVTPFNHLRSASGGCALCDKEQMRGFFLKREESKFLRFFERNLSERLEIRSEFRGMTEDLALFCKVHQSTSYHKPTFLFNKKGFGCNECAREKTGFSSRLKRAEVIPELNAILPEHIKVLSIEFDVDKRASKVLANCELHGDYETTTAYLRRSEHKCPKCGHEFIGYAGHRLQKLLEKGEQGRPTYLGVMEVEVFGVASLKVGVTARTLEERYKWYLKHIFLSVQLSEVHAYILENQIKRAFGAFQDSRILKAGMRAGERWNGDTECYRFVAKEQILTFIHDFVSSRTTSLDYKHELEVFCTPSSSHFDVAREKSVRNKPIPVVGVDPITNRVVERFESTLAASRAGFKNVSMVLSDKYDRQLSGGLRWFRAEEYAHGDITHLAKSKRGSPRRVLCIETGEVFDSISSAAKAIGEQGLSVSGSHITSVCKGRRKSAAGYTWSYLT